MTYYLGGSQQNSRTNYPIDVDIEALHVQKEILKTQKRMAAQNSQIAFQQWMKRDK